MSRVVIFKFGGKLLGNLQQIRKAADLIIASRRCGESPVVVVSAPGSMTDDLIARVNEITDFPDQRELDMLLSVGERTGMALLAMMINENSEFQAISFTGSQVGIITDTCHNDASILEVRCFRIAEALNQGLIPVVAGFQGVSTDKEITTLGRGGSDATAMSLAVALNAERCDLIKECGGIFDADPQKIPKAKIHPEMDYVTLENYSSNGAVVVQPQAVSLARKHNIRIWIRDNSGKTGSIVSDHVISEKPIAGITLNMGFFIRKLSGCEIESVCDSGWEYIFLTDDREGYMVSPSDHEAVESVSILNIVAWGGRFSGTVLCELNNAIRDSGIAVKQMFSTRSQFSLFIAEDSALQQYEALYSSLQRTGAI